MTTQQPAPGEFDDLINADNADSERLARPLEGTNESLGGTKEVKAKRADKSPKPPMGKKQKMMLFGGGGLLVIAASAALMFGDNAPPSRVAPTANVAEILTQTTSPGSEPETAMGAPFAGFEDVPPVEGAVLDTSGDPTLDALNAFALAADGVPVIGEPASVDAAELSAPVETAATASPVPVVPSEPSVAVVDTSPELDAARMRIEALEGDLKRAQEARRVAERNRRVPVTVVAVLDDGVVVRDARGREKVLAVGEQVRL